MLFLFMGRQRVRTLWSKIRCGLGNYDMFLENVLVKAPELGRKTVDYVVQHPRQLRHPSNGTAKVAIRATRILARTSMQCLSCLSICPIWPPPSTSITSPMVGIFVHSLLRLKALSGSFRTQYRVDKNTNHWGSSRYFCETSFL
jgi:hypothetical protein